MATLRSGSCLFAAAIMSLYCPGQPLKDDTLRLTPLIGEFHEGLNAKEQLSLTERGIPARQARHAFLMCVAAGRFCRHLLHPCCLIELWSNSSWAWLECPLSAEGFVPACCGDRHWTWADGHFALGFTLVCSSNQELVLPRPTAQGRPLSSGTSNQRANVILIVVLLWLLR